MSFKNKIIVITGGGHGIGKCCAECFSREGAIVHVIDVKAGPWFVGDPRRFSKASMNARMMNSCTRRR